MRQKCEEQGGIKVALDRYATAVERAIFNWYFGGENAPVEPVFNTLQTVSYTHLDVYKRQIRTHL